MTTVPVATPVTTPLVPLTVATAVLDELHVPPAVGLPNEVVPPTQTVVVPVLLPGATPAFMVTVVVTLQPGSGVW